MARDYLALACSLYSLRISGSISGSSIISFYGMDDGIIIASFII